MSNRGIASAAVLFVQIKGYHQRSVGPTIFSTLEISIMLEQDAFSDAGEDGAGSRDFRPIANIRLLNKTFALH